MSKRVAVAGIVLALLAVPCRADEECPGTHATVAAAAASAKPAICEAAAAAEGMLAACGIVAKRSYAVRIVPEIRNAFGHCIFGSFRPGSETALVVTPEAVTSLVETIPAEDSMHVYRSLPPTELYRSLIVHEITHAIVHQNLETSPCRAVHEYAAAVAQIGSMSEGTRQFYLQHFSGRDSFGDQMFNDIVLAMDPARYAAAAYRHFAKPANGCGFLQRLWQDESAIPRVP